MIQLSSQTHILLARDAADFRNYAEYCVMRSN